MDVFSGNFIEFSKAAILTLLSDRLKQKTVRTAFPDNLTSSHSEKIEENSQETSRVEEFFLLQIEKIHHHRCFPVNFLNFFGTAILTVPGDSYCSF